MNDRIVQFRVGVMVLATLMITAILVLMFGGLPDVLGRRTYTVEIHMTQAPGVSIDTPIRKNGILIGRVRRVEFAEDRGLKVPGVVITAGINRNRRILANEVAKIAGTLLGDAVVEIVPSDREDLPSTPLSDGDVMVGVAAEDPLRAIAGLQGDLSLAVRSVARTSDEIGVLARNVSELLENNQEQFTRIVRKAELAVDQLRGSLGNIDEVVGDPLIKDNLRKTINDMPRVLADLQEAVSGIRGTLELADRNLTNLEGLTRPLGDRGGQLVANVERATSQLDTIVGELAAFSRALNNPEGSLGRLISDPHLYQQVNSAVENINDLTRQVQPILRDARVFTDKIARHPESLIRRNSGIK